MQSITTNGEVNPARFCEECDEAIHGEAHQYEGYLVCPPCWAERKAEDCREAADEADGEIETLELEIAELDREFEQELARLRALIKTWRRRGDAAKRELGQLGSIAAAVGAPPEGPDVGYGMAPDENWRHPHALPPIAGGGPFEPSEADWRDYRDHFDRADGSIEQEPDREPERPLWGYE